MKKLSMLSILFLFLCPASPLFSQSNDILDSFLVRETADTRTAAYLVLTAAGVIDENAGLPGAESYLMTTDWGIETLGTEEMTYGSFARMSMEVLDMKGGLFYRLFHSPRYAAREFTYRGFIPGKKDPRKVLTPLEVLTGLNAVLDWKEAGS